MRDLFDKIVNILTKNIYLILIYLTILLGVILFGYHLWDDKFPIITTLSGISAYLMILVTSVYVYTTSQQVQLLNEQISILKTDRNIKNHPLPWMTELEFFIDPPEIYRFHNKILLFSRYFVYFAVINKTSQPVFGIDCVGRLFIPGEKGKSFEINTTSVRIDVLSDFERFPNNIENNINFMFTMDINGFLLEKLLSIEQSITFTYKLLFKNIYDGYYSISQSFALFVDEETSLEQLNQWLIIIRTFKNEFYQEIEKYDKIVNLNSNKADEIYQNIKLKINEKIDSKPLKIKMHFIANSLEVKVIDSNTYDTEINNLQYSNPSILVNCSNKK